MSVRFEPTLKAAVPRQTQGCTRRCDKACTSTRQGGTLTLKPNAAFVAAIAKNGAGRGSTGSHRPGGVDGSCACIVFVMKPPRPPVQALVDSRSVIFCERFEWRNGGEALYSMSVVNPK